MSQQKPAILFRTSSAADIISGNGLVTIAGAQSIEKSNITAINQITSKAEVQQVTRVGTTSYTPVGGKAYTVSVSYPGMEEIGTNASPKLYSYLTPSTLTGTAADQREEIHTAIVSRINEDTEAFVTATSLGSGNGIAVTDKPGYYPPYTSSGSGRQGASRVRPVQNADDSGFAATNYSIYTPAIYSFGLGADLAASKPVVDPIYNGLISGYFYGSNYGVAPKTSTGQYAVDGQNYDAFIIQYNGYSNAYGGRNSLSIVPSAIVVFVDNGTGSSTSNRLGFLYFEKEMRKLMAEVYSGNHFVEFYDSPILFQGPESGAVPSGTAGDGNKVVSIYGAQIASQIGTQSNTTPTESNSGLILDQDLTGGEGAEYTPSLLTTNKQSFIVGKSPYTFIFKNTCADHTDANLYVALRKKASHAADFNNYTDFAGIGFKADLVYTWGILNDQTTVETTTTVVPIDGSHEEYVVCVDINGVVTTKYNGVTYPVYSVGTTPMVFEAGDEIIPTYRYTNISTGDPDLVCSYFIGMPSDTILK